MTLFNVHVLIDLVKSLSGWSDVRSSFLLSTPASLLAVPLTASSHKRVYGGQEEGRVGYSGNISSSACKQIIQNKVDRITASK